MVNIAFRALVSGDSLVTKDIAHILLTMEFHPGVSKGQNK